ncbi:MAG: hypothetical protein AAF299_04905, partial [Pseudomonadota bacterium]
MITLLVFMIRYLRIYKFFRLLNCALIFLVLPVTSAFAATLSCAVPGQSTSGTLSVNNSSITEPLAISNLSVGASVDISATATTGGNRTVSFSLTAGSGTGPAPASFALNANGATGTSSFTNSNVAGTADIDIALSSAQNGNRTIDWTATCAAATTATVTIANTTDGTEPGTDGVLTVSQSVVSPTNTVIAYSVGGSATPGSDYTALSGTITILAGQLTATIDVEVLD